LGAAQPALAANDKRAFFTAWSQLWGQQASPDVAARLAASEVHAPGQWRANGPLANQPAFGEAFTCKAGTPMQGASAQQVSIWR